MFKTQGMAKNATRLLQHKNYIKADLYEYLYNNLKWLPFQPNENLLRYACAYHMGSNDVIDGLLQELDSSFGNGKQFQVWFNLYRNGNDITPRHRHLDSSLQIVLSLGGDRLFTVGDRDYMVGSGDVFVFTNEYHSIPKYETTLARISMVMFYFQ